MRYSRALLVALGLCTPVACTSAEGELGVYLRITNGSAPPNDDAGSNAKGSGGQPSSGVSGAPQGGGGELSSGGTGGLTPVGTGGLPVHDAGSHSSPPASDGGSCLAGPYGGTATLNCATMVDCSANTGVGVPVTAFVSLQFSADPSGSFASASGTIAGEGLGYELSGSIGGRFDCDGGVVVGSIVGTSSGFETINSSLFGVLSGEAMGIGSPIGQGTLCVTVTSLGTAPGDPCAQLPAGTSGSCVTGSCKGTWQAVPLTAAPPSAF